MRPSDFSTHFLLSAAQLSSAQLSSAQLRLSVINLPTGFFNSAGRHKILINRCQIVCQYSALPKNVFCSAQSSHDFLSSKHTFAMLSGFLFKSAINWQNKTNYSATKQITLPVSKGRTLYKACHKKFFFLSLSIKSWGT
jgi:hypothetical protein